MVQMIDDVDTNSLTVRKSKDNQYLQLGMNKILIQTPWMTLQQYPLTGKSFVKETDGSVALTLPVAEGSDVLNFFREVDKFLAAKALLPNKTLHRTITEKDGKHFVKFKVYLNTALLVGREEQRINTIYDFYKYLTENTDLRIIFSMTKLWTLNSAYGFSVRAEKIQLKAEQAQKPSVLDEINRGDFSD